jgi:hypothetical protein
MCIRTTTNVCIKNKLLIYINICSPIMKFCPNCKSYERHRLKRPGIYKYISGLKCYECDKCGQNYIWHSLFNKSIKVKTKKALE